MRIVATILVLIISLMLLVPAVSLVLGSFRSTISYAKIPPELFPTSYSLTSYKTLLGYPVARWLWNSFWTTTLTAVLVTVLTCYIGYVFAKKDVPFKEVMFWMFMTSLMIPGPVTFIPGFVVYKQLGLINTFAVLIVPSIFSVGWMFFFRQFISKIPNEMFDMAEIDGAGEFGKVAHILLPLCIPAMASVMIFTWIGKWADYITPLMYIITKDKYVFPMGMVQVIMDDMIRRREELHVPNYGLGMAGGMFIFTPMVLVFIFFHRYFVKGIFEGSVKG